MSTEIDYSQAYELESINRIINRNLTICGYVMQDLSKGRPATVKSGASGMTAELVLRVAIVKMLFGFARCTWKGLHSFKSYGNFTVLYSMPLP